MEFLKHTLPNGLEVVAESSGDAYTMSLGFFVKTGARDETDEVAGVSHFLEHMVFKGTPTRSADDVNRRFDEIGAHYNAGTGEESTVYYATVLPEYQDDAVELLGDLMRPSLREADFDTEKLVILEEIRMYEDQPPFGADEKCRAIHYGSHPLGRSVLGSQESITALAVEAMREYHRRRYSPANIVLVAAGRIDFDALCASAERFCGSWKPIRSAREVSPAAMSSLHEKAFHVIPKESATQQYAVLLSDGPAAADDHRYAAKLLATILGDDSGSRLYWELVDPGLAEQAVLGHSEYEGGGLFMTYLSCQPELAAENLQRIRALYRQAETDGVTAQELSQAKNKISSLTVLSGERSRGRLFAVGTDWIHRRQYCSVRDDLEAVAGITVDDVAAVLAEFPLTLATTVSIGPLAELSPPE